MLMDFKGPLHTRHKNTRAVTNTQPHTESVQHCQGRALSVDELSWSQTLQLSYSIICKRWIRVPYNYSLTEAQCNNVSVYVCVCGCAREKRAHLKVTAHSYRAYSGMFTSATCLHWKKCFFGPVIIISISYINFTKKYKFSAITLK